MRTIKLPEFAARIRERLVDAKEDVVWFLGAGCSISSGIPAAGGLVSRWAQELHGMRGVSAKLPAWTRNEFKTYDPANPATAYAEIFEARHPNALDRQLEIERVCARGEAAYGYATFAQIITDLKVGSRCNTVLTTNFDDLVAEAVYQFGALRVRPQIITHDAVAHYARPSQTRPTIVKLHGDAHLDPRSLSRETAQIDDAVADHLYPFIKDSALVFMGYGGNDRSISGFLKDCPLPGLAPPIFWVGTDDPSPEMMEWLESRETIRVDHRDFDDAMHVLRDHLKVAHPSEDRWARARARYFEALEKYEASSPEGDADVQAALEQASASSAESAPGYWAYLLRAFDAQDSDPNKAYDIYKEGIRLFPNSRPLLSGYASFLHNNTKDYDAAEEIYKRAMDIAPDASTTGNYALFLKNVRNNNNAAEEYYRRAIDIDPFHANNLSNYSNFLTTVREDHDTAEEFYKRAIEADPTHAYALGNYALFLTNVRKDYDTAEALYKRALETDPANANNLAAYALFLTSVRKDHDDAEALYKRAIKYDKKDASILCSYAIFLTTIRKKYLAAEKFYKSALKSDPTNANIIGNYAQMLLSRGDDEGLLMLDTAKSYVAQANPAVQRSLNAELSFYALAHDTRTRFSERMTAMKSLIQTSARSEGWDFSTNIERAALDGHAHVSLLKAVAEVISNDAPVETLDAFPEWRKA